MFCDSKALAPKSFNDTTVASDGELQIATLTQSVDGFRAIDGIQDT